jgi:hypothetical protein
MFACLYREPISNARQSKPVEAEHGEDDDSGSADRQRTFCTDGEAEDFDVKLRRFVHRIALHF